MDDYFDDRLKAPQDRQDELLEVNHVHDLADVVDAHSDSRYDLEMTTRGLDTAILEDEDHLSDVVGYAGNFSNDGMAGDRVDDALMTDFDEPESVMAGEYGPPDADLESDMMDNLTDSGAQSISLDEQSVLSSGVGAVHLGASAPTGFQIETISAPGEAPQLINERGEPDFAVTDPTTDDVTPASARGLLGAEDNDDIHSRDVTEGT